MQAVQRKFGKTEGVVAMHAYQSFQPGEVTPEQCNAIGVELARIAAYLHDIGNLVNRVDHSQSGAVMAWSILNDMGCDPAEIATIVTAIGNHDEG
ncbi:MAG: relaxase/mobilization nuclease domain-containing protein, partial [Clostridiales bacterium]|nr:relaxase/mobilization nuclease domain-containing protein [Clostridiales bacterium]